MLNKRYQRNGVTALLLAMTGWGLDVGFVTRCYGNSTRAEVNDPPSNWDRCDFYNPGACLAAGVDTAIEYADLAWNSPTRDKLVGLATAVPMSATVCGLNPLCMTGTLGLVSIQAFALEENPTPGQQAAACGVLAALTWVTGSLPVAPVQGAYALGRSVSETMRTGIPPQESEQQLARLIEGAFLSTVPVKTPYFTRQAIGDLSKVVARSHCSGSSSCTPVARDAEAPHSLGKQTLGSLAAAGIVGAPSLVWALRHPPAGEQAHMAQGIADVLMYMGFRLVVAITPDLTTGHESLGHPIENLAANGYLALYENIDPKGAVSSQFMKAGFRLANVAFSTLPFKNDTETAVAHTTEALCLVVYGATKIFLLPIPGDADTYLLEVIESGNRWLASSILSESQNNTEKVEL